MTNREAFNEYIRKIAERQISYMEGMSDDELLQYTIDHRDYGVRINIGDKLCYFKAMVAGMPVGNKQIVSDWFKHEAPQDIPWEKML